MEAVKTYYTAREAADIIGVSYRLILKWIADGELTCYWIGDNNMIRISSEQIDNFMENHKFPRGNGESNGEVEIFDEQA